MTSGFIEKAWAQHAPPGCKIHSSYAPALPVCTRGAMIDFALWSSLLLMNNAQKECANPVMIAGYPCSSPGLSSGR